LKSSSGANILDGRGLQSVRDFITKSFEDIRTHVRTDPPGTEIDIEIVDDCELDTGIATDVQIIDEWVENQDVEIELIETDDLDAETCLGECLREADGRAMVALRQNAFEDQSHRGAYHISVPTESAEQLFTDALRLLDDESDQ
jgi:hypothetical protein